MNVNAIVLANSSVGVSGGFPRVSTLLHTTIVSFARYGLCRAWFPKPPIGPTSHLWVSGCALPVGRVSLHSRFRKIPFSFNLAFVAFQTFVSYIDVDVAYIRCLHTSENTENHCRRPQPRPPPPNWRKTCLSCSH